MGDGTPPPHSTHVPSVERRAEIKFFLVYLWFVAARARQSRASPAPVPCQVHKK